MTAVECKVCEWIEPSTPMPKVGHTTSAGELAGVRESPHSVIPGRVGVPSALVDPDVRVVVCRWLAEVSPRFSLAQVERAAVIGL